MPLSRFEKAGILVTLFAISTQAQAYLDPGTGSMLLQGAIAGIATAAYAIRLYWARIKAFLSGKPYVPLESLDDSLETEDKSDKG